MLFAVLYTLWLWMFASDTPPTGDAPPTAEGAGKATGAPTGETPAPQPSGDDEKRFTQAQLDQHVSARLAQEKGREEKRAAEAKRKADEESAVKNGEWKTLAEQRAADLEARSTEVETLKAQAKAAERYAARLNTQIDGEIAAWPAEVTALDPGKADPDARAAWVEKGRPLAQKLGLKPKAPATEAGSGGNGAGGERPKDAPAQGDGTSYRFQQPGDVRW